MDACATWHRHDLCVAPYRSRPLAAAPAAWFGGTLGLGLAEVAHDASALDRGGWWAVVVTYEGRLTAARFNDVQKAPLPAGCWPGVPAGSWASSMDQASYEAGVAAIRDQIAAGEVYQANLCRVLSAAIPAGWDIAGLAGLLAVGNPAPFAGLVHLPDQGLHVATASPELFLRRAGRVIESGPIKGTGRTTADLLPKDEAENIMIVDLVRNDLGRVCVPGSVTVPQLLHLEHHPGLVHLVSTVRGELVPQAGWADILEATFPPGSVTGAPKSSALRVIDHLEGASRGVYCGAVGWVDADRGRAELAVGIRTFWADGDTLHFGTGAGITWGSDPYGEWAETELKASRLLAVAAQEVRV
jgi:para-aminobenzoate synthetase component 1